MARWLAGFLVLGAAAVLAVEHARVRAQEKTADVKEVMTRAHKGSTALLPVLGKELKCTSPPWDEISKQTRELVGLATSLGKNPAPTGEKDSWEKLTQQYLTSARDLDEAAQKKDKKAAEAAHARFCCSCSVCHKAHRAK
jgi:hypothetical protein